MTGRLVWHGASDEMGYWEREKKLGKKRTGTGNIFTMMGMKNYVENGHDYSPGLRSAVNMRRIAMIIRLVSVAQSI